LWYNCYTAGWFEFDARKSERLRANPKRGIGFEEAREIFFPPYYPHRRSDFAEQYGAIGWAGERLFSVIFEAREDERVSISISSFSGKQPARSNCCMKNTRSRKKPPTEEAIARLADQGRDLSPYVTNAGRMMAPVRRVNVDFTAPMLQELDNAAKELNVSRQAVIKTLVRQALDQHYLAAARATGRPR
jgi:uncharacterized DUF497 family protein